MATLRTAKIEAELSKAKTRLTEQQGKVKELEQKKTELENMDIVEIVRNLNVPLDELTAMLTKAKGIPQKRKEEKADEKDINDNNSRGIAD